MANGEFVSYIRCSTRQQESSGLGLESQRSIIGHYLNGGSWRLLSEHVEVESGTNNHRPELTKALSICKKHKATLIISRLDRMSRNSAFINQLLESNIDFVCCDFPEANKLTIRILAAVAQWEAETISLRTKAALVEAKKRGVILGNPNIKEARLRSSKSIRANADEFASRHQEDFKRLRKAGFTLSEIASKYNLNEVRTARGGIWSATQVSRIINRQLNP